MGSSCTTPSGSRHLPISPSTKWRPRNGNNNGLPPRILTKLDQSGAAGQKITGSPPTRHVIRRPPARGASSRTASSNVISRMSSGWDDMSVVSLNKWTNCVDEQGFERATNRRSGATGGSILRGNPFGEIATDTAPFITSIMQARCNADETSFDPDDLSQIKRSCRTKGDDMDLAMMFGVFIFGTFGAGTLLFLYKVRP